MNIHFSQVSSNDFVYRMPEKRDKMLVSKVQSKDNEPVFIETPRLRFLNYKNSYIELEFQKDVADFYNYMRALDSYNIDTVWDNIPLWFGEDKEISRDFLESAYISNILPPQTSRNGCVLRVNVPIKYNRVQSRIYNQYNKTLALEDIPRDANVVCILRFCQLEISKTTVRAIWELEQMKVFEKRKRLTEYCIKDEPDDYVSDSDMDDLRSVWI